MNWKSSISLKGSLFVLIITLSIFLLVTSLSIGLELYEAYQQYRETSQKKQTGKEVEQKSLIKKEHWYLDRSPLSTRNLVTYRINNQPLFEDYIMIAIQDINGQQEEPLFIGEGRTGRPHWLDDDHIFFTTYCGTACQGIYLIDVRNKETKLATLSFTFTKTNNWETHFSDWFGRRFQFPGLLGDIGTESTKNNFYLVFNGKDQSEHSLGVKKFLFTGDALVEQ